MPLPELRQFQIATLEKIRNGFKDGHKRQVVCAPTGAGKTILAMSLIESCYNKGKRAVFMADRKTLVNQSSTVADLAGLTDHSVFMAQHERFNPAKRIQIASIQTIARRGWPEADLYVIDECHTLLKAWTNKILNIPGAVIGLSATPFSNLGGHFTNLINAATMKELVADEILVPMRTYSCTQIDMKGAETRGGEWTERAAAERGTKIIGDVVKEWQRFGEDRKTIVFGANIAHCENMCGEFNSNGVVARMFTAYTKDAERLEILREFEKADSGIKVLISVEALAKGFDNKLVSCICDVRPLRKSFSTAVQMWGRMLRCADGKKDAILLDFSGNIMRFAPDFEDLYHNGLKSLKDGEILDKTIRKEEKKKNDHKCPKCAYTPFFNNCMSCGYLISKKSEIEHKEGQMREINIQRFATNSRHLFNQCYSLCDSVGDRRTTKQRCAYLYKSITGEWPTFNDPKLVVVSKEVVNHHKMNIIKWSKQNSKRAAYRRSK